MARRDGFVVVPVRIPRELRFLVDRYADDMKIISFTRAIQTLLETHPQIDKMAQIVYSQASTPSTGEDDS